MSVAAKLVAVTVAGLLVTAGAWTCPEGYVGPDQCADNHCDGFDVTVGTSDGADCCDNHVGGICSQKTTQHEKEGWLEYAVGPRGFIAGCPKCCNCWRWTGRRLGGQGAGHLALRGTARAVEQGSNTSVMINSTEAVGASILFVSSGADAEEESLSSAAASTVPSLRGAGAPGGVVFSEGLPATFGNETLALAAGEGAWDLNDGAGPWCNAWEVPGREASSKHGLGDRGWDPCCFWDGCKIFDAVWDSKGNNGGGTWCSRADFVKNGGTCYNSAGQWDFWTGGYLYDWCPCNEGDYNCQYNAANKGWQKQLCIATEDNNIWWDWHQCWTWTKDANCWKNLLEAKCFTEQSKDVCYKGFIQAPNGADGASCADGFKSKVDDQGLLMCWPAPA